MTTAAMTRINSRALYVVLTIAGSLLIAASARISTPMYPVPMTLQTLAVVVLAGLFGPRLATAMAVTYLLEGAAGLPVFAHGAAGPLVLVGPTAGYLLAFPIATLIVGHAANTSFVRTTLVTLAAHAAIIALGTAWLATIVGGEKAIVAGAAPFVLGSIVKSLAAAAILALARRPGTTVFPR